MSERLHELMYLMENDCKDVLINNEDFPAFYGRPCTNERNLL